MPVDSFKYLSRLVTRYYKATQVVGRGPIPWTPLLKPLAECTFSLVTSGGLYHKTQDPPFDVERERRQPSWGDPSYRVLPADLPSADLGVSHNHINPSGVLEDMNVLMPLDRFRALQGQGRIGGLAPRHYSFMGYQGFPSDLSGWEGTSGPQVADRMEEDGVDCVFITTA